MNKTLAIIIPAYNEEKYIKPCLESITTQLNQPDEVIVVDNNSKDKTAEIAHTFHVKVVTEEKQGMTNARNKGLNTSTSDILGRIDADTILLPGWTDVVKESFKDPDVVGVTGPVEFYEFSGWSVPKNILQHLQDIIYFQTARAVLKHDVLCGPNMAIRANAWKKIKNDVCDKDHLYHEDTDLTAHISQYGKIVFNPKMKVKISARTVFRFNRLPDYAIRHIKGLRHAHSLQKLHQKLYL